MRLKLLCGGVIIMGDTLPIRESILAHAMFLDPRAIRLTLSTPLKTCGRGTSLPIFDLLLHSEPLLPPRFRIQFQHGCAPASDGGFLDKVFFTG